MNRLAEWIRTGLEISRSWVRALLQQFFRRSRWLSVFFSSCMWFICFVRLFICSFFSTFKCLIMFDSMSKIPCTLLGQRIIQQILINEWDCFILNSKFDSLWHFLIPQNSSFLIFCPHPFPPLSLQTYSICPFTGNFVLDKKQNRVLPHSAIHKRNNLVLRVSDFG